MSIVRGPKPSDKYTIIRNELIEDSSLSVQARMVMVYLLSKPDTWQVNPAQLATIADDSRIPFKDRAVYAALRELIDAGYVKRSIVRNAKGIAGHVYTVYDCPQGVETAAVATAQQDAAKPKARSKSGKCTFAEFTELCAAAGEQRVSGDDEAFKDLRAAGIPDAFIELHTAWFLRWAEQLDSTGKPRRYAGIKGWRQAFRNSVRGNWSKLWYLDNKSGQWCLTQAGIMAQAAKNRRE